MVAAQLEDLQALLHQVDERQEAVALQAVLVEIVGRAVGGGDHRDAFVEQGLEQAAEDHRIGDVGDLEFVEAEQARLGGDRAGDRHDGVGFGRRALGRELLAAAVQALLDLEHEFVEVHAPLLGHRRVGEEQVHQHRLAAADRAPDVEAVRAGQPAWARAQAQPRQQAGPGRMGRHRGELVVHGLQPQNDASPARDRRGFRPRRGAAARLATGPLPEVAGDRSVHCGITSSPPRGCL